MPEFIEKVSPGVDVMKPKIWQRPHASIEARSRQGRDEPDEPHARESGGHFDQVGFVKGFGMRGLQCIQDSSLALTDQHKSGADRPARVWRLLRVLAGFAQSPPRAGDRDRSAK